jgi:hypothetical protein
VAFELNEDLDVPTPDEARNLLDAIQQGWMRRSPRETHA